MSEYPWRPLKSSCTNCLKPLEGRPKFSGGRVVLAGCEPMEYRHTDGTTVCVIHNTPRPYSDWGQFADWEKGGAPDGE